MVFTTIAEVLGVKVTMTVDIDPAGTSDIPPQFITALTDDADSRVNLVMRRETQRIAEISAVDFRDQSLAPAEADRIRNAPKDRSHVIVGAGTRDADPATSVQVVRGTVHVAGRKMSAPAPFKKQGPQGPGGSL